jgi:DNA-binding GntR family transcriptional regulator
MRPVNRMVSEVRPQPVLSAASYHRTAHQYVRDALRRAILTGNLPPGTHLVQGQLAAELEVSTTPVREALRDLASEGLVEFDPHRGAIVHELDLQELLEIYDIRKVLEPLAFRRAVQIISEEELKVIEIIERQMSDTTDAVEWTDLNWQFHHLLELGSSSTRLRTFLQNVQDASSLYVAHSVMSSPERMKRGNEQHSGLLDAVRRRDVELACNLLVQHLDETLQEILMTWGLPDRNSRKGLPNLKQPKRSRSAASDLTGDSSPGTRRQQGAIRSG